MKRQQGIESIRWDLALRYRLIETIAWWEGRLTTGHLMQSFGISRQQASRDINSYLNEYAPENLEYDRQLKGYKPTDQFRPVFIDDSASAYLHLLSQNQQRAPYIEGLALAYTHTEVLQMPDRSIRPELLRPLLRACREGLRVNCQYVSLSNPNGEERLIAPHTLVYTGMRWHLRAYCEKNKAYRDFVLSRFRGSPELQDIPSEKGRNQDPGWDTQVQVRLTPDPRLRPEQRAIIETDYGMAEGKLVIHTRGALAQYVLQRYQINPANPLNPDSKAQQLVVANLDELRPWLWLRP